MNCRETSKEEELCARAFYYEYPCSKDREQFEDRSFKRPGASMIAAFKNEWSPVVLHSIKSKAFNEVAARRLRPSSTDSIWWRFWNSLKLSSCRASLFLTKNSGKLTEEERWQLKRYLAMDERLKHAS
ncbi:hypothetical protein [Planomicrobium sp. YIM 101495]|uniref:hypothetical protein n=1 Tax=Planomicrobium sp. YIM 101495 TaxID=2665160 RepID=UPI0018A8F3F0|nr:hypothetical protein [Planomicrobium sp. YIM 101495]